MGFENLLGNERLKENLQGSFSRGRIAHFYLISGPKGSGKHTLARLLAAGILCSGQSRPCGTCPACRKALEGRHPDIITVDEPEKKTVSVELVRRAREDLYIRPNEAEHKIYIFPRGQELGLAAQNALLKVLEEPPSYGVFLLLTDNPEKLLPTIRSRCTELQMSALPRQVMLPALHRAFPDLPESALEAAAQRSAGILGQAMEILQEKLEESPQTQAFAAAYAEKNTLELLRLLVSMEKWKRDALADQLTRWRNLLAEALLDGGGDPLAEQVRKGRSPAALLQAARELDRCGEYLRGNVSPAAVCGYLAWALR